MTIVSAVNTQGLSKASITPNSGVIPERDPFAPNYDLIIRGGKGAQPFGITDEVKRFISEITFEDNADQFDHMTITLENQLDSGGGDEVLSFMDSKLFAEGHIVEVQMGYGNTLITVGAADIVKKTPDFPSDGPPTLAIEGYDLLHRAARKRPKGGVSYKGYRDSQIASIIGSRNGFDITTKDPSSFAGIRRTSGIFDRVQKRGVSDYEFLKKISEINGFDLFSKFNPKISKFGLFFQPGVLSKQKEVFTFFYNEGGLPDYQNRLLSFTPTMDAADQSTDFEIFTVVNKEVGGSKVKFIDRLTIAEQKKVKADSERRFTGGNTTQRQKGVNDGIEVAFKAYGRSFRFPPNKRFKNEFQARKAIEEFVKRQKENFITASGEIIGNEVLQSRQVHNFQGLGEQISGKYYLTIVKQIMSKSNGYATEFSCRKVIEDSVVQSLPTLNLTDSDKRFEKIREG